MKRRHEPERTCLGCGARDKQKNLIRFVARSEGVLQPDGRHWGRGGYLHRAEKCWEGFLRRKKKIYKTLHREITREARERLIVALRNQHLGEKDG